jgi:hypothetical protein
MGYLMSLSRYLDPTSRVLFHGVSVCLNNSVLTPLTLTPRSDSLTLYTHSLTS